MTYGIKSLAQILESGVIDRITQAEAIAMVGAAPISHASAQSTYGLATQLLYGHAKSSSTTPSAPLGAGAVGTTFDIFALADHVHPVQTEITGTAALATRLAYPVRIGVIGAATAEAIEFDGSEGIFLKVTRLDPYALDVPVPIDKGGTGISTLTKNSILYAKETNEWGQITPGTSGQLLTAGATGVPEFKTLTLPQPSSSTPAALGVTGDVGSENAFSRGDHVHPLPSLEDLGGSSTSHDHEGVYLPLDGGVMDGPISAALIENKSWYDGVTSYYYVDSYRRHVLGMTNLATVGVSIFNKPLVVRIHGYRIDAPNESIDFNVGFEVTGDANSYSITKKGWVNNGTCKPDIISIGMGYNGGAFDNTNQLCLCFEFATATSFFVRADVIAYNIGSTQSGELSTSGTLDNWGFGTIDTAPVGWTSITELLHTPDTHAHAIADLPKLADGTIFVGAGTSTTLGTLDAPSEAGTKWLKVVTALEPASQTLSWANPVIADVTGLQTALNGKSETGHTHNYLPTAGGTVTGTITSTATTIMYKAGASGVVTFVSGDMVVASKLALSKIDPFRYTNVYYLRDADGDVSATQGIPTQLGSSQHTAGTDSVLHLIIGGTSGLSADFTRYLNLPELGTGALEGDKIEMVITNLSSTYKGQIQFNPSTSTVTFRTVDGLMLTQSERYFASGERIAFHAIKTTSGGSLCWRVVKTSETAF